MAKPSRVRRREVVHIDQLGETALASRSRFKKAALALIDKGGYSSLRVEDIARRAGLAKGLFYRYFKDSHDIAHELWCDFFDVIETACYLVPFEMHPYDWFYHFVHHAVTHFCEHPGLLACGFELQGSVPAFRESWKEKSRLWNLQLARFLEEKVGLRGRDARDVAFVLGAMMEGVIYQDLVRKTEHLRNLGSMPEQISEIIVIGWYRTVFLELPPREKIKFETRLLFVARP